MKTIPPVDLVAKTTSLTVTCPWCRSHQIGARTASTLSHVVANHVSSVHQAVPGYVRRMWLNALDHAARLTMGM